MRMRRERRERKCKDKKGGISYISWMSCVEA
jgi:hypothetical protein